ncbi:hypothetical protein [Pseudomonas mosselii]|uniref:hypothetical protein n=1 Tax=Pseudomonas mosselii TaxID=78327 RepID=UPI0021DA13E8|nr:hypothetical protein [Pseudomonas mosselii]MCU9529352.1 hypothetical protein [Pseudomonas mosselii]MCU9536643.1 hypothetical protein [Pseudomonas mosselii]MCU9542263.1 hypothetical protein [Pseudomonas mosselii]MCU9548368.1 hypothetical protein [Pseudomonas mosselii]
MRMTHSPFPKHAPHIIAALERARVEKADGVLSGFRLLDADGAGRRKAGGYTFGRAGFADETPIHTSEITVVGLDDITTSSGSRYVIADYCGDAKAELKALKAEMRRRKKDLRPLGKVN